MQKKLDIYCLGTGLFLIGGRGGISISVPKLDLSGGCLWLASPLWAIASECVTGSPASAQTSQSSKACEEWGFLVVKYSMSTTLWQYSRFRVEVAILTAVGIPSALPWWEQVLTQNYWFNGLRWICLSVTSVSLAFYVCSRTDVKVSVWIPFHLPTESLALLEVCVGLVITWLILPVVICLSQRLSHACLSVSFYTAKLRMAH